MSKVIQDALNSFVADLRATHRDNLHAVVLYGAAAVGDTDARSDHNLLVALQRITPEDLRLAQAPMREWQRLGYPVPIYFTVDELASAADVFPIEFHKMERARRVLYGQDPFANIEISNDNLRHQTEYELRSKLLQLRRLYIPASASPVRLVELMGNSLASFTDLFAPVLILKGITPPTTKRALLDATVRELKLNVTPFNAILSHQQTSDEPLSDIEANELFTHYLDQLERVIQAVDELQHTPM